jgi:hypothetical protein
VIDKASDMFLPFLSGSSEIEYKGFVTYYVTDDGYLEPCLHPGDCQQTYPSLSLMDTRMMLRLVVPKITEALQKQIPAELQKKQRRELVKNIVKRAPTQVDLQDIFATPSPTKEHVRCARGGGRPSIHEDIDSAGSALRCSDTSSVGNARQPDQRQHFSARDLPSVPSKVCNTAKSHSPRGPHCQLPNDSAKQQFPGAIVNDYMGSPTVSAHVQPLVAATLAQSRGVHHDEELFPSEQNSHAQIKQRGAAETYSRSASPPSSLESHSGDGRSLDDGFRQEMPSPFSMGNDGLRSHSVSFSDSSEAGLTAPGYGQIAGVVQGSLETPVQSIGGASIQLDKDGFQRGDLSNRPQSIESGIRSARVAAASTTDITSAVNSLDISSGDSFVRRSHDDLSSFQSSRDLSVGT